MVSYLLDSNIVIDYLNGREEVVGTLRKLFQEGGALFCCAVVIAEVMAGIRHEHRRATREVLDGFEFCPDSRAVGIRAGGYRQDYRRRGTTLALADTLIAAIAVENDLCLVTRNRRHYPMPELRLLPLE